MITFALQNKHCYNHNCSNDQQSYLMTQTLNSPVFAVHRALEE